jgi:hypothetical protein
MPPRIKLTDRSIAKLLLRCMQPISAFRELGDYSEKDDTIFIDNGGSVLAIAHLDVVQRAANKPKLRDNHIVTGRLDDRLGVWGILDALPKQTRAKYDILLTNDEEIGKSTAGRWTVPKGKEYNWIFSLDRRGLDAVTYMYKDKAWEKCIEENGFKLGYGSVSDISYLQRLGVCGVNFGIGYHNEHSETCHANLSEVAQRIFDIGRFISKNHKTRFEHTTKVSFREHEEPETKRYYAGGNNSSPHYPIQGNQNGMTNQTGGGSHYKHNHGHHNGHGSNVGQGPYKSQSERHGSLGPSNTPASQKDTDTDIQVIDGKDDNIYTDPKALDCFNCGSFTELWWNFCVECGKEVSRKVA